MQFYICVWATFLLLFVSEKANCKSKGGLYSFNVKDINGDVVSLEKYRGMISLVVNVASECGYTDTHYRQLGKLYNYLVAENGEPFMILAFPCNQFGNQEPYDNKAIVDFVRKTYDVEFPIFHKIEVTGNNADPVYGFLARNHGSEPTWNFWKYLIDEDGAVIGGWGPRVDIDDLRDEIKVALEKLKAKKRSEL